MRVDDRCSRRRSGLRAPVFAQVERLDAGHQPVVRDFLRGQRPGAPHRDLVPHLREVRAWRPCGANGARQNEGSSARRSDGLDSGDCRRRLRRGEPSAEQSRGRASPPLLGWIAGARRGFRARPRTPVEHGVGRIPAFRQGRGLERDARRLPPPGCTSSWERTPTGSSPRKVSRRRSRSSVALTRRGEAEYVWLIVERNRPDLRLESCGSRTEARRRNGRAGRRDPAGRTSEPFGHLSAHREENRDPPPHGGSRVSTRSTSGFRERVPTFRNRCCGWHRRSPGRG